MKLRCTGLTLLTLILGGCISGIQDLSELQYVQQGLTSDSLNLGGLALLMVDTSHNEKDFQTPFADSLGSHIHETRPSLRFIKWKAATASLDKKGLGQRHKQVFSMDNSSPADRRLLVSEIGLVLDVRYFLVVRITRDEYAEGHRVTANAQLWDSRSTQVIWIGIGRAFSRSTDITMPERNYEPYARTAAIGLVSRLP